MSINKIKILGELKKKVATLPKALKMKFVTT